jgi:hypothetical protein
MVEADRAVHDTTAWVSAGSENRMLAKKTHSGSENCQKRTIQFPFKPKPDRFGARPCIHERSPQRTLAPRSSRGWILNLSADRSSSRSASIYNNRSSAHLAGLQAPPMLGVHAAVDHVATAVVSVGIAGGIWIIAIRIVVSVVVIVAVRVEAEAETSPEVAIMKSTAAKFTTTKSTSVETTSHAATMETASHAAAMEPPSSEAATMEAAAAHAAAKTATPVAAAKAAAHATPVATATATTTTGQRHRWRHQANGCNCQ